MKRATCMKDELEWSARTRGKSAVKSPTRTGILEGPACSLEGSLDGQSAPVVHVKIELERKR